MLRPNVIVIVINIYIPNIINIYIPNIIIYIIIIIIIVRTTVLAAYFRIFTIMNIIINLF